MFSIVLLGSCSKEKVLSVKFTIDAVGNAELRTVDFRVLTWRYDFNSGNTDVISLPFAKRSDDMTVEEGDNILIEASRRIDIGDGKVLVEVYINDEVVETRTLDPGTWSTTGNYASFTYIVP